MEFDSLWGEEFIIPDQKQKTKKIKEKIDKPKVVKAPVEKQVKSKVISLDDKLKIITEEVLRVLGKQKDNIICIKDRQTLHDYISKAIVNNIISIDTETNNSLDPITCKLMGPCIYTPGEKQAYIPINHRDKDTKERLSWQLTEQDIKEEFQRLLDANTFTIMHNGKFDYQVIKCTCFDLQLNIDWDTMIASKLIDENEYSAGLKQQYISKIDPNQEKYSIDHLFEGVEYADVDPEIFAYYAATDALMTYKLYEYQLRIMQSLEFTKVYKLFKDLEMPLVKVIAEMELAGMEVCQPYAEKLSFKYHKKLDETDAILQDCLSKLDSKISAWRLTPEACNKSYKKQSDKQYNRATLGTGFNPADWKNENGVWYKLSKPKAEQLDQDLNPASLASPTQLGIILYDILKLPVVNREKPYSTGEEELNNLKKQTQDEVILTLLNSMLKRRELVKLITTYIDNIPELAKRWPDGRVRTHFNQYGAATGRLSSSDPINFQNIPAHEKSIRMLFKAKTEEHKVYINDDYYEIPFGDDIETTEGWKYYTDIKEGMMLKNSENTFDIIKKVIFLNDQEVIRLYV